MTGRYSRSRVVVVSSVIAALGLLISATSAYGNERGVHRGSGSVPAVTGDLRVDRLIAGMTLDEKVTLLQGAREDAATNQYQAGYLPGIPRLGIPSLRLSDGPPGVATKQNSVGMTQSMGVAATFSSSDAKKNGVVIGRDAKALGIDVVLEPFVNMDRDLTWGRAFNVFGEDPLLTGRTGAAEIEGIQSQGTMAQVKHYIAYDGANNVVVDSQTLHEIYLAPFTDAVNAGVSSVMCSYNIINSYQSCGNATTLTQILRNELGFKGFVTSDWGANHGLTYINAGLDMEMPGGSCGSGGRSFFCAADLKAAVADGTVSMHRINQAVGRILYEEDQFGLLSGASKHTITPEPVKADEKVVQQTAEDAATLLKNQASALPLNNADLDSLAMIGPGAGQTMATYGGGEKSAGLVDQQVGTVQALRQIDPTAHIDYAVADDMTGTPVPASAWSGLTRTASGGTSQPDMQINYTESNHNALPAGSSYSWSGTLTAPTSGDYRLAIQYLGATASLTVDGNQLASGRSPRLGVVHAGDNAPLPTTDGLANSRASIHLSAGPHTIQVVETPDVSGNPVQVRLAWYTPAQQQADHDAAVTAAQNAHAAVVFAWSGGTLNNPLPDGQDQLIADIAAVNPNTIVVLNNNLPVAMPWLGDVSAVLDMWFPGDSGGYATANVLLGKVNPAGRLPYTWPTSLDQMPANDPAHPERSSAGVHPDGTACTGGGGGGPGGGSSDCTTTYSEGIDIGYRWFDKQNETPLYPFGYGLSYANFHYSDPTAHRSGDGGLDVSFNVTNTGDRSGDEVPQVYLGAPSSLPSGVQFAVKALAGYDRISLGGHKTRHVTIHVPLRQLQYWSDTTGWTTASGTRTVYVGPDEHTNSLTTQLSIN